MFGVERDRRLHVIDDVTQTHGIRHWQPPQKVLLIAKTFSYAARTESSAQWCNEVAPSPCGRTTRLHAPRACVKLRRSRALPATARQRAQPPSARRPMADHRPYLGWRANR